MFGVRGEFAIEATICRLDRNWIDGYLRFYLQGLALGDPEDVCNLAASARWARVFLQASAERVRPDLEHRSAVDVFHILYGRYIVEIGRDDAPAAAAESTVAWVGAWDRNPYVLDEVGDAALRDKYALLVVRRSDGTDRVLLKSFHDDILREHILEGGMMNDTISAYCLWVEAHLNERPKT